MGSHFLGHYLMERGVADTGQIEQAAAYQSASNRKLGDLAVEAGLLSPDQVEELLALQRETDLSFGQLAVDRGFVTRREMNDLLFRQQVRQCHLGEALLTLGHITPEQFSDCLEQYSAQERERARNLDALYRQTGEHEAVSGLVSALERAFLRFARCPLKAQGTMSEEELVAYPCSFEATVPLSGGRELSYTLSLGPDMVEVLRRAVSEKAPPGAVPGESLRELMGLVCRYPLACAREKRCRPGGRSGPGLILKLACPKAGVGLRLSPVPEAAEEEP